MMTTMATTMSVGITDNMVLENGFCRHHPNSSYWILWVVLLHQYVYVGVYVCTYVCMSIICQ